MSVYSLLHILDDYVSLYRPSPQIMFLLLLFFERNSFFVCVSVPLGFREILDFVWRRPSSSFMFQITVTKYIICGRKKIEQLSNTVQDMTTIKYT